MNSRGSVVIADDDTSFVDPVEAFLRREGYDVRVAGDCQSALSQLHERPGELLLTDPALPGNEELELVRQAVSSPVGLAVIVATSTPTTASAIASVDLRIVAYLLKPVDLDGLGQRVERAVARCRSQRIVRRAERRLARWHDAMEEFVDSPSPAAPATANGGSGDVDAFMAIAVRNAMGAVADMQRIGRALVTGKPEPHPCQLLSCPRGAQLQAALNDAIAVLEETRGSFNSKQLGTLRRKLELLRDYA